MPSEESVAKWRCAMNEQQIWHATLERLCVSITPAVFATWFQETTALSLQDGVLVVGVPTTFTKAHLEARYLDQICSALCDVVGTSLSIRLVVSLNMLPMDDVLLAQRDFGWQETGPMSFLVVITKEESSYKASVPDIPGCLAVGKTREEAAQGVRDALQAYLEMRRNDHESLPEPQTTAEYIRLPLSVHQENAGSKCIWKDDASTMSSVSQCSFCDTWQEQGAQLTSGPGGVHICHECVDYCREMIEQGTIDFQQLKQALTSRKPKAF